MIGPDKLNLEDHPDFKGLRNNRAWTCGRCTYVQVWTDDGECQLYFYHQLAPGNYQPEQNRLRFMAPNGILIIQGPKVGELVQEMAREGLASVKRGPGIESVMLMGFPREEESASPEVEGAAQSE
jgi:hypothetical protein